MEESEQPLGFWFMSNSPSFKLCQLWLKHDPDHRMSLGLSLNPDFFFVTGDCWGITYGHPRKPTKKMWLPLLGGAFSKGCLCSPRTFGKWFHLTSIFFKWVETTNSFSMGAGKAIQHISMSFILPCKSRCNYIRILGSECRIPLW